ncbi:glucosyl transferase [Catellatospora sp. TT07R-123]|uniref:glycosyltransferase family 2 protein n=1 Tax=Catellatospora sp. TT07R-123 TaxID=2733863 RepID=UPI001B200748|nr:glycosyltransferase family 2 protein [Catellatospora sp. TT07R-123]GHJ44578.1 glucosyl transferase [Catellatospora sp. TT07R-123]
MNVPLLSVVIPMYNEQEVLPLLIARLRPLLDGAGIAYEVVAVDDGSTDATGAALIQAARQWPGLRVVRLRRNSGHQAALTAGLHRSRGHYVASIDADLQDPPEKILEMLDLARAEDLDIVYGVRDDRTTDSFFKRHTAQLYYRMMRRLVGKKIPHNAGDFRLLSRIAVDALKAMPEHQPVYRLLVPWLGFPSGEVTYRRDARAAGSTKYPLSKMIKLAVDSVTNFSAAPLRLATWSGLLTFLACLVLGVYSIVQHSRGDTVSGWTSLFTAILFVGGLQLLCLGLLGEYLGRLYAEVKGRPTYIVGYDSAMHVPAQEPVDEADGDRLSGLAAR